VNAARPVGLVVAVEEELLPFDRLLADWRRLDGFGPWEAYGGLAGCTPVTLVVSDCGPVNAGAATERLLATAAPLAVLNGGSAGAHDPELMPGDVVIGEATCILFPGPQQEARAARGLHPKGVRFRKDGRRVHLPRCPADARLLALGHRVASERAAGFPPWSASALPLGVAARSARVVAGLIGSADAWTRRPEDVAALRSRYGTLVEDMESAFVAQVCALHDVPFLAVRVVSNNETIRPLLPDEVAAAVAEAGARAADILVSLAALLDVTARTAPA
jgi:adenosylhomocysteine nucleosidase